ncbi:MAG: hypothetical protein HC906_09770 [Bacteroidales bacterium]|nr:hypothetical protein [Bacteroidales bacterium]
MIQEFLSSVQSGIKIITGELNGNVELELSNNNFFFTSGLTINDLALYENKLFNEVKLNAQKTDENTISLNANLTGNENNIEIDGKYSSGGEVNSIDLDAIIQRVNLATLQPVVSDQFNKLSGFISGNIRVTGTTETPDVTGLLRFDDVLVNPVMLNAEYSILDEEIEIGNQADCIEQFYHFGC